MKKSDNSSLIRDSAGISANIIAGDLTQRHTERAQQIFEDSNLLEEISFKLRNVRSDISQGNMFEQIEVIKFNQAALKADSTLFAKTTASMGRPTDPVDMIITDGRKTVREIQAKSCGTATRSTIALSNEKYKEMARLAPKDQNSKIKELLDKRIKTGTLKAEDYEQTRRNLQRTLNHDGVASEGTTYQEAFKSTNKEIAKAMSNEHKLKASITDMHKSGKASGNISAGIAGSISTVQGSYQVFEGDIEIGKAVSDVAINSAKGYAQGYVTTALSKGITHTTTELFGKSISNSLTKSNAPVAISVAIINTSKSFTAYLMGEIESDELLSQVSHTAIISTSSFYYGVLGQIAIPVPVVGAMVGAGVGYIIGNMLHQSSLISLGECLAVKEAKERRKTIEAICLSSIPQMKKNRAELEQTIETNFNNRKEQFYRAFEILDFALDTCDPNEMTKGLENINNCFGVSLQFTNFKEFDEFMEDENTVFDF